MDQVYILKVIDAEDRYEHSTLVFKTEKELDQAKELIQKFDKTYYQAIDGELPDNEYDEGCYSGYYYDDLNKYLDSNGIKVIPRTELTIFVR